jgi:serine phosphatase RsbU (regulator of sigma subunit)
MNRIWMKKILACLLLLPAVVFARDEQLVDSLIAVSQSEVHDTSKVDAYLRLVELTYFSDASIGVAYNDTAVLVSNEALKTAKGKVRKRFLNQNAIALNNIAYIAQKDGNVSKALDLFYEALVTLTELGDTEGIAQVLNSIGYIHKSQGNFDQALIHYNKSLVLREEIEDQAGIAMCLNNIGVLHQAREEWDEMLALYKRSFKIYQTTEDLHGIGISLNNMADAFDKLGEVDSAYLYYYRSVEVCTEADYSIGLSTGWTNIAEMHLMHNGKLKEALKLGEKAYALAEENNFSDEMAGAAKVLYQVHKKLGNSKEALQFHEIHEQISDSLANAELSRTAIHKLYDYEYSKVKIVDSVAHEKEKEILAKEKEIDSIQHSAELSRSRMIIYAVSGGVMLLLVLALVLVKRNREKQRANLLINEQKDHLQQKNKEIIDSIEYAKYLQEAILPPDRLITQHLPESFILYKPKDIIAGDFYWLETRNDTVYFAAADCTGHGVPGAMVSVICSNALTKALVEEGIEKPGLILDRTRELVVQRFNRSEEAVMDGMDISLCALDMKTNTMQWAGANNPLWIHRKDGDEIEVIQGDYQPIAQYPIQTPFSNHEVSVNSGDMIYLFSDGFADQFGGQKAKKLKAPQFKKWLLTLTDKTMAQRSAFLENAFEEWKGDIKQLDDVCVFGVRI